MSKRTKENKQAPLRVLITAGASGIGAQVASDFLTAGHKVALCDMDENALKTFKTKHATEHANEHADTNANASTTLSTTLCNVTDPAQMQAFFTKAQTHLGGLDVVIANAGTGGPAGAIEDISAADWNTCIATNLGGAYLTAHHAAPIMRQQGTGLIVFMSSTAGLLGYPYRSPYATAKWGIIGLTKTLAMELGGAGIRVNAICPGAVEGERMERVLANESAARGLPIEAVRESYVQGVSLKTWVTASDISAMIQFLASPAGAKISGQALPVDGHTETLNPA